MTREEYEKELKYVVNGDCNGDCVSRQAVRDTIFAECSATKLDIDFAKILLLQRAIKALPPVIPQSKYEDIVKAFQLGLAFGFGEKHDEMDKIMEEVKKFITPQSCKDAISRAELIKKLEAWDYKANGIPNYAWKVIRELPTVTPAEKMGQWIDDKCSVCGKGTEDLISSCEWYQNENPKYCPFCGIKIQP